MSDPVQMIVFAASLIAVCGYILHPVIRAATRPEGWAVERASRPEALVTLLRRRDTLLHTLRDLEDDLTAGNLSQEDYDTERARFMREASIVLDEIDKLERKLALESAS